MNHPARLPGPDDRCGKGEQLAERFSYPRPPIVEALVQFRLGQLSDWNPAIPGLVFGQIRDSYPSTPEAQNQLEGTLQLEASPVPQFSPSYTPANLRMIYKNVNEDRLLVLARDYLSANSLPPYEGWPSLIARLSEFADRISNVVNTSSVSEVSIRYINRIHIPGTNSIRTEDYFNLPVRVPVEGASAVTSFFHRTESVFHDGHDTRLFSNFASAASDDRDEEPGPTCILDLELRRAFPEPVTLSDAVRHADELKAYENQEFEACITDRTRELFQ